MEDNEIIENYLQEVVESLGYMVATDIDLSEINVDQIENTVEGIEKATEKLKKLGVI